MWGPRWQNSAWRNATSVYFSKVIDGGFLFEQKFTSHSTKEEHPVWHLTQAADGRGPHMLTKRHARLLLSFYFAVWHLRSHLCLSHPLGYLFTEWKCQNVRRHTKWKYRSFSIYICYACHLSRGKAGARPVSNFPHLGGGGGEWRFFFFFESIAITISFVSFLWKIWLHFTRPLLPVIREAPLLFLPSRWQPGVVPGRPDCLYGSTGIKGQEWRIPEAPCKFCFQVNRLVKPSVRCSSIGGGRVRGGYFRFFQLPTKSLPVIFLKCDSSALDPVHV